MKLLIKVYIFLFARRSFYRFHQMLYLLSLKGLGITNGGDSKSSGEFFFIQCLGNLAQARKSFICFDVGAHTGEFAETILNQIRNAKLFCFEPNPYSFKKLQNNPSLLKNKINCYELGFSNIENFNFLFTQKDSQKATLYQDESTNRQLEKIEIKLSTIDNFCHEKNIDSIQFLKIDVEGEELNVLKGAEKMISENKIEIIQFEFNTMNLRSKSTFYDFIKILGDKYTLYRLLPSSLIEISYHPLYYEIYQYQNIVAITNTNKETILQFT